MTVGSAKPSKAGLVEDDRDVADLWKAALNSYKGIVGFDLEKTFNNTEDMINQGVKDMNAFHKFRHDEKKVDKLRSLFAANIGFIEQGSQQLIAAATPAFPPAAAIGTAITYMLKACRQVSADYDIVVVFFQDMNSFLQRIVILETRMPKYKAYQNCLMDVFTSFLCMTAFAHKYIKQGRFAKWVQSLMFGQDSELGGARKDMDKKLENLQNATETAILGNTEELKKMNDELKENQDFHTQMLQEQKQVLGAIQDTTERISTDVQKLILAFEEHKRERAQEVRKKPLVNDQMKAPLARQIRAILPNVESELHEYHILKETLVPETGNWIFEDPCWEQWLKQDDAAKIPLAITGQPGTGKSHLATIMFDKLQKQAVEDTSKHTCVAHFHFREQHQSLWYFLNAVISCTNQVAEQSVPICEAFLAQWRKDDVTNFDLTNWRDVLKIFLAAAFHKESKYRLFIVFDGVDEIKNLFSFTDFLKLVKELELRVVVAFTSRSHVLDDIYKESPLLHLDVNRERQVEDLKTLIWSRLSTLQPIRRFSSYVKQRIVNKLVAEAPNMLYAEHMIYRFNSLDREGAVLRNMERPMPPSLYLLYEGLWESCYRRTAAPHQELVRTVLHWIAYAVRPLHLNEVESLLEFLTGIKDFDTNEIPEPFTHFLRAGDLGSDAEERAENLTSGGWRTAVDELDKPDEATRAAKIYDDGALIVNFRERAMRTFFQTPPENASGLRWTPSESHRQLFLICARIARFSDSPDAQAFGKKVQGYAITQLFQHWRNIEPDAHSIAERVDVMEEVYAVLSNKYRYASLHLPFEGQKLTKYQTQFSDETFENVSRWAKFAASEGELRSQLSEEATAWWEILVDKPRDCLLLMAKAHHQNVCQAQDIDEVYLSFGELGDLVTAGKFKDLMIQQAEKNFPSEISTESKDESQKPAEPTDEPQKASERDIALGIPGLFDTPLDDRTYYSAAEICLARNQRKPAETFCRKALETCNSPTLKYECLFLLARILRRRKRSDEAYENITQVLPYVDLEETPAKKKQAIWVEKARIEAKIGHKADALSSYGKAKAANPSQLTTGDALDEELHLFLDDRQKYLSVFKSWTPLERLTWMGWRYADWESNRHRDLRDVSAEAGETDFVIKAYEESIQYLDNVNAGAPLRNELALMYLESCDDLESARHVLDEVLDSHSSGWPYAVTDESPDITLEKTVLLQSNVLFRLFCRARDPTVKQELFDAAKGVMARPLAMDLPSRSDSELVPYHMTLLHMSRKMGPAKEFFALAQSIVDICVGNLLDNVGHNDSLNLVRLAKTLYILSDSMKNRDQLRHLANIFCSAKFSRLTTEAMADDNWEVPETVGDESDDEADEAEANGEDGVSHENMTKPPADEGDILSALTWGCDGECNPSMTWEWFGDQPMYDCLMCDYILCQPCYDARQADNAGVKPIEGRKFCGKDHKYIKTPMPGWKGIRNGKITIDGEDPEDFGELLVRFRDEILKETWSAFWEGA